MRALQIVAALSAAVAFCLAFMAAGAALLSALFMALGLAALGWLGWSLLRQATSGRKRDRGPAS